MDWFELSVHVTSIAHVCCVCHIHVICIKEQQVSPTVHTCICRDSLHILVLMSLCP